MVDNSKIGFMTRLPACAVVLVWGMWCVLWYWVGFCWFWFGFLHDLLRYGFYLDISFQ